MKNLFTIILLLLCSISFSQNKTDDQDRKQGVWKKGYKNSAVFKYVGQFKDDKPYGEFIYFYESGNIQSKIKFYNKGIVAYNVMYHESSGYVMAKGKYSNEQKDSLWLYYDNQGHLKSQENYKNGKLNGQRVVYYEPINGQYVVAKFEYYSNGVRNGQFKEYYPNTKLKGEGIYKTGNLSGIVKYYRQNGSLERVERYQYAVKHGWWIFFDENSRQIGSELFWEGKKLKGEQKEKRAAELKANSKANQ
jgi:antitoxin component YwqK of YwqJK toxin-antitoxin module